MSALRSFLTRKDASITFVIGEYFPLNTKLDYYFWVYEDVNMSFRFYLFEVLHMNCFSQTDSG